MTSRAASSSLARVSEAVCVLIIYIPISWYGLIAQRFQGVKRVASDCLCRDTWHTIGKEKYSVPFSLIVISDYVTYTFDPRPVIGRGSAGMPDCGRVRRPRAGLQPAPGRLWASSLRHYDRSARCYRWTGTGRGG